jgi:branched-chain amino acid transport system ATP-binding protein
VLQVDSLYLAYGKIQAVRNLSLAVHEGELVAIIGANGAGKTTLLNAIIGIKGVNRGRIMLKDKDITALPAWKRVAMGIGIVPEGGRVFPDLSVEKNLLLGAYQKRNRREIQRNMDEVFHLFPILGERRRQIAGTLSGGERQMLAIGRALMNNPSLLLVDEISMGLMPKLVTRVFDIIPKLRDKGISVLLAEQNAQEALSIVDRALVMENGRIVLEDTPKELMKDDKVKTAYLGI